MNEKIDGEEKQERPTPDSADASSSGAEWEFPVVALGASAGGIQALKEFFKAVPKDTGMAFIVVQHLDPTHESHMADVLSTSTRMPVTEAADGMRIQPDHIYTAPSNRFLSVRDGCFSLDEQIQRRGARMPVDYCFRSLAEHVGSRAICIVLSGSGSDGTLGIREVRGMGGMTVAQDPEDAEYTDMPRNSIETGMVDTVVDAGDIPGVLEEYVRVAELQGREKALETVPQKYSGLDRVIRLLSLKANRDLSPYKESTLRRRLQRRMGVKQVQDVNEYIELLREDDREAEELARDMLVGVTSFFRESAAFDALQKQAIRPLVRDTNSGDSIRVWVPGCWTGEEAYSIAILLHEELAAAGKQCKLQVFGTDVEERALEVARQGSYPGSIATDVSEERLDRFFVSQDDSFQVGDRLRDDLVFARHDLLSDPPFCQLDLLSCRNVLIYLKPEAQKKVIGVFAFGLKSNGYLFLGQSDGSPPARQAFEPVSAKHRLYCRTEHKEPEPIDFPFATPRLAPLRVDEPARPPRERQRDLTDLNQRALLEHYEAAVVLVKEDGEVLHFFGPTERFISHPTGKASLNLTRLTEETLPKKIGPALRRAAEEGEPVHIRNLGLMHNGSDRLVNVTVRPVERAEKGESVLAVVFEEGEKEAPPLEEPEAEAEGTEAAELRDELRYLRQDYHATVEELETSNEELRAANEEVVSMNEELQSTNEELQSSKEELQSMNEELNALNDQLNEKVNELREANADLTNLFRATGIPTLFLDSELRIKRVAPPATELLNIRQSDAGRPVEHISGKLAEVDLQAEGRKVLKDLNTSEREVQASDGTWYMLRVTPYRTPENKIDGVVMTFTDVTRLKETEAELEELNEKLEARVAERAGVAHRRAEQLRWAGRQLIHAEQRERQRMARVLHDNLQQDLQVAQFKAQALQSHAEGDESRENLDVLLDLIQSSIRTARSLTAQISPPVLFKRGLLPALEYLALEMEKTHGLSVETELGKDAEPDEEERRILLYESVHELLTNVAKHANTNRAWVRAKRREDGRVMVTVEDRGAGFDTEEAAEPRGDTEAFGLFSVGERMRLLEGELELDSTPGEGTTATLLLPLGAEKETESETKKGKPVAQPRPRARTRGDTVQVLIADDHSMMREGLAGILGAEDDMQIVGEAADGKEAVRKAESLRPDVVLMDVSMPELNGIEAAKQITTQFPDTIVVGLSMHEESEMAEAMKEAGAQAYVTKSAATEELVDTIRASLARAQDEHEESPGQDPED